MDCQDYISVALVAILQIAADGIEANVAAIWARMTALCPYNSFSQEAALEALTDGFRRGIFYGTLSGIYCVQMNMAQLNPENQKYFELATLTINTYVPA